MAITREDFPLPDTTDERTAGYFEAAARGELAIPRCDACHAWCWYPREDCATCGGTAFTWTATSGRGRLFSWVVAKRAFLPAFAVMVPFATGLVSLEEDPTVRIVTLLPDVDPTVLVPEMPMEAVFRPLSFPTVPGASVTVPMFVPAAS